MLNQNKLYLIILAVILLLCINLEAGEIMMWQAEVNNKTIYLVGSIHLMKPEFYPLPVAIEAAARNAETFIFETDINAVGSDELMSYILQNSMFEDGTTIDTVLADSTFALLTEKMENIGYDMNKYLVYKPWYLSLIYTMSRYRQMGFSEQLGIDRHFYDLARELNRRIGWFADPLEHTKLLLSLSNIEPNQLISHTIKQTESHYYNLENLYKLWRSGNNEELAKIVFSSFEYSPEVMETLVYQRNREWAEKILEFANDEKNYFIVVGTGHLIGKDSLVDLLEKEGISFKQKKFNQI